MRGKNAVTLKDVAREAGVAKMTASVVLNGARSGTHVSEATRARILEAAARLGYRPNGVARGLTRRRMDTLGVVTTISGGLNLYFLELFSGILSEAARQGQNAAVLALPSWDASSHARMREMCDGRLDGLILLAPASLDAEFVASILSHTPLATIHPYERYPFIDNVDVDDEEGAYKMVRHLLELGHRRIAYLPGSLDVRGAQRRLAGYRAALEEAGILPDPALVIGPGDFRDISGQERTERLLDAAAAGMISRPTAICCANDAVAVGCLRALSARGLRVPEDVSVTGFDDLLLARTTTPPLSTLRQPFQEMGAQAVRMLLEQIGRPPGDAATPARRTARTEIFPAQLVPRGSTAPPALP